MPQVLKTVGEADSFPRDKDDPIALFQTWFREAVDSGIKESSAMTVATVDPSGYPDARIRFGSLETFECDFGNRWMKRWSTA